MSQKFVVIDTERDTAMLRGVASLPRMKLLRELAERPGMNVNELAVSADLPQSSVSAHLQELEKAGLVRTEMRKARKGSQKVCFAIYDEIVLAFSPAKETVTSDQIEVSMPLGLYTAHEVTGPCGICSTEGIIGLLDVPETFIDPERMKASLLWFTSGFVEYQFPNNAKLKRVDIEDIEIVMEISSEVPGTQSDWPSDILLSLNGKEIGAWTSPGDFGDRRGQLTPSWWKLKGSQYGMLKTWRVGPNGSYVDGQKISDVTINDLNLSEKQSIRVRIEVRQDSSHPGGVNIFGRGFGNYDQDIVLRLNTKA